MSAEAPPSTRQLTRAWELATPWPLLSKQGLLEEIRFPEHKDLTGRCDWSAKEDLRLVGSAMTYIGKMGPARPPGSAGGSVRLEAGRVHSGRLEAWPWLARPPCITVDHRASFSGSKPAVSSKGSRLPGREQRAGHQVQAGGANHQHLQEACRGCVLSVESGGTRSLLSKSSGKARGWL